MDNLTKDVLFNIATFLPLNDLIAFCNSDTRVNRLVCQDKNIWNFKLAKEFPDYKSHVNQKEREAYELLIALTKLIGDNKYQKSIYEFYKETEIWLCNNQIQILPPEIGKLNNLQRLYLDNNQITLLPPEIGKLSNLHRLSLNGNEITSLPPEIGKLNQLQYLYLSNNKIEILPSEIGNLNQLQILTLYNNKIEILPSEIGNLNKLRELWLDKNVIIPSGLKLPVKYL